MENTSSLVEHKAIDLLDTYSGANNYILYLKQKKEISKKFYPTRSQADYIVNYFNKINDKKLVIVGSRLNVPNNIIQYSEYEDYDFINNLLFNSIICPACSVVIGLDKVVVKLLYSFKYVSYITWRAFFAKFNNIFTYKNTLYK